MKLLRRTYQTDYYSKQMSSSSRPSLYLCSGRVNKLLNANQEPAESTPTNENNDTNESNISSDGNISMNVEDLTLTDRNISNEN